MASLPLDQLAHGLTRAGFDVPEATAPALVALGGWPPHAAPGAARLVRELAASPAPDLAARTLADIAAARSDGAAFTELLRRRPGFRRRIVTIAAASRSMGRWLVSHPEEADRLVDGSHFVHPRTRADLVAEALAVVGRQHGQAAAWEALRRFKRRELVRIAVRDLLDQERPARARPAPPQRDGHPADRPDAADQAGAGAGVAEVGAELAALAEACLAAGLARIEADRAAAQGRPPGIRLAVLGMGKLGGAELNYVSDIDVLFCHEPLEGSDPEAARAEAERTARELLAALGAVTPEGACFRVDANLRPEGRNGPLSRTLAAYQSYWQRWAEPWEFQALIKVRAVAGDAALGASFCAAAAEVVYPSRLDPATVASVRRMKARAEASPAVRAAGARQVKLGPGGIRDVEFAVQLLQLVHGREDRRLRTGTTLLALSRLAEAGLVGEEDGELLAAAYRFLRAVEHRLQLANEQRTHTIPTGTAQRRWLARTMGYRDGPGGDALDRFELDRRRHAVVVRTLHEKLFYRPLLEAFGAVPAGLDPAQAADRLSALGFADPDGSLAHLRALTSGLSRRAALLRVMLPVMLPWIAASPDPDGGLAALRTLAQALGDQSALLAALRDNPGAAERLCRILGTSRLLGDLLARHPELVHEIVEERGLRHPRTRADLVAEALAVVGRQHGQAAAWEALRRFKRRELVRIAVRDLLDQERPARARPAPPQRDGHPADRPDAADQAGAGAGVAEVGAELAALAEACLAAGLARIEADRAAAQGRPPGIRLAVLGMGKLGGAELNYVSDIDVLFCHEPLEGSDPEAARAEAERTARELLAALGAVTPEGACFRVDANLRPEGRNGPLSRTLAAYQSYWQRWAEPWEFQALIKVRAVAGDAALGASFCAAAAEVVYPSRLDPATVASVRRMKARVESERLPAGADPRLHYKLGPGGMADVEWTAQLLQLEHGREHPAVRAPGTLAALEALMEARLLDWQDRRWLEDAYRLVARLRNLSYLVLGRQADLLPTDTALLDRLARAVGGPGFTRQRLQEDHRRATRRARRVVEQRFWGGRVTPT